jgi:hypothetical protein
MPAMPILRMAGPQQITHQAAHDTLPHSPKHIIRTASTRFAPAASASQAPAASTPASSGTQTIAPPTSSSAISEPQSLGSSAFPITLFVDDFETPAWNGFNAGWDIITHSGLLQTTTSKSVAGSHALEALFTRAPVLGTDDGVGLSKTNAGAGLNWNEIYVRWYTSYSSNFMWPAGAAEDKNEFRATEGDTSQSIVFGTRTSGGSAIWGAYNQPAVGWMWMNVGPDIIVQREQWYCLELHIKKGNPGIFEGWVDGVQKWNYPNINMGRSPIQQITLLGNFRGGAPIDQSQWVDQFVVSDQRINCLDSVPGTTARPTATPVPAPAPTTPTGLTPTGNFPSTTTSVVLSWNAVPGATYAIRVDYPSSTLRDPRNNCPGSPHYLCINGLTTNSISVPVRPGTTYSWWVHIEPTSNPPASASFSIAASPSSQTVARSIPYEAVCSNPAVWACYDFEDGQIEPLWSAGNFFITSTETYGGSRYALDLLYPQVPTPYSTSNGGSGFTDLEHGGNGTDEFHLRYYVKYTPNWVHSVIAEKGWQLRPDDSTWDLYVNNPINGGGSPMTMLEGTAWRHEVFLWPNVQGFDWSGANLGRWVLVEYHIKLNTPGLWATNDLDFQTNTIPHPPSRTRAAGEADGVFEQWIDGVLITQYVNLNIRGTSTKGVNDFKLSGQWNCYSPTHPGPWDCQFNEQAHPEMHRYIDNIVIMDGDLMIGSADPANAPQ